jgi:copper resistance protein B
MGHCKPAATAPTPAPAARQAAPAPASDPNCPPEHAAMGHCKPSSVALPPAGPPPASAFTGPEHAQDLFYNTAEAARSRGNLLQEHGGLPAYRIFVDQAEVAFRKGRQGYSFDAQAWYGGDINKLWIKTEGEGTFGEAVEGVEVQALWSRAIDPWFDAQLGVRQDLRPGHDRSYLVAGVQGLAPYWFEVEGAMFLSTKGDLTARFEAEYDLRLTQSLILQPLLEADLALQDVPELGIGSGLSTAEIGARLRYQFRPKSGPAELSPYLGIKYDRAFGNTARFRRLADEDVGGWSFLVGLRTWF